MRPFVRLVVLAVSSLAHLPAGAQDSRPDDVPDAAAERGPVAPGETCAAATLIPSLPFAAAFNNDLFAPGGGPGTCNTGAAVVMQNDGWFVWTAPVSSIVTLNLDTPVYDAIIQVYRGASCAALTQVVCGDEPEPINIAFNATAGETYWFQLGDWGTAEGGGNTTFVIEEQIIPGESCAAASLVAALPFVTTFNSGAFTADGPPGSCNAGNAVVMQNDAWHRWTANASGALSVGLTAAHDAIVQVHSGPSCAALTPVACLDEPQPIQAVIPVTAGQTYWLQTGQKGIGPGGGPTTLTLSFVPPGEACVSAVVIASAPLFTSINIDTNTADGPPGSCNSPTAVVMQNDHWYRWTAPVSTNASVCVNFPAFDGIIQLYAGASCNALVPIACANEPEPAGITWSAVAGTTYWIQIGDWGTAEGGGVTDVSFVACHGDANFDGFIDFNDITIILGSWLQPAGSCAISGDANLDGIVDFNDITAVLANWLTACP